MKKLLFILIIPSIVLSAEMPSNLEILTGYVDILSYEGNFAGVRLTQPLNSWFAVGAETATSLKIQDNAKINTLDFTRVHLLIRLSKSFKWIEPYIIGGIGKDSVGENPEHFYDSETTWENTTFDRQLGMTWHAGVCTHLKSFVLGVETGGGTTGTGYIDYNLVIGYRF